MGQDTRHPQADDGIILCSSSKGCQGGLNKAARGDELGWMGLAAKAALPRFLLLLLDMMLLLLLLLLPTGCSSMVAMLLVVWW